MADRTGQQLDDYRLIRLLGTGTFGEVYLGEHVYQQTQVAVKVLNIHLTPDTIKDFLNEARTVRLKHPNILQIVDFGIAGNTPFLVMDYAPNGTLRQRHPQGTLLPLQTILPYVKQVAAALQYAHNMRLIHRDVKPQNMLLGSNDQVLISDFGIAVVAHTERSLTMQEMAGTVPYMAPEQIRGKPRPASDQYALGIVVYEWLCGVRPFRGSQWEIIDQHLSAPPPSLKENVSAIPPAIEQVILTALAKDPQQRFASIQAFANALEQASRPEAPRPSAITSVRSSPPVTPIVNPNPKPPATPIPASSVLESPHSSPPTPSPSIHPSRDTVQFGSLPATSMPSTSRAGDGQSPPLPPASSPFISPPGRAFVPQPAVQTAQQKRGRLPYPTLATALQSVVQLSRQKPSGLFYPTVALLILLLLALIGGGGYYVSGTMSLQHIQALIAQAQAQVRSNNPSQALQHLASAQNMLQALPADPFLSTERTKLTQQLTTTVKQAIQSYDQQATITPLCPATAPAAPINDGSTGTHAQRLASVQAGTGPAMLYALGQDGKVYQLNSQDSLANLLTSKLQVLDITGDDARLAMLLKASTTNNYFLGLGAPGQAGQPQVTDLAAISPVNGEIPILVTAQGSDVYVVLASPPAATTGQVQAHILDFTLGPGNILNPNPLRTSFSFSGTLVSAAAFPSHLLFLLLADSSGHGSLSSLQVTGKGTPLIPAPVLVSSPIALPLAVSSAAFTPTTPVPVPAASTAIPPTGPLPLQLSSTGILTASVVGNVPHLYIAESAHNRVLELSEVGTGGGVAGSDSNSVTLQLVQQYASSSILVQMTSIAVDSKGMVVYVLTQSKSNPPVFNLVSIDQAGSSCA